MASIPTPEDTISNTQQEALLGGLDMDNRADWRAVKQTTEWVYWKTQEAAQPDEAKRQLELWKKGDSLYAENQATGPRYVTKRDELMGYIFGDNPNRDPSRFEGGIDKSYASTTN